MKTVEEIHQAVERCIKNLNHLARIHPKWEAELPGIDRDVRPVGYENQIKALQMQEDAFDRESKRLLVTSVEEWFASLGELTEADLENLKDALKAAQALVSKEQKRLQDNQETDAGNSLFEKQ